MEKYISEIHLTLDEFCDLWDCCFSVQDVANRLGVNRSVVLKYARHCRRLGVPLKKLRLVGRSRHPILPPPTDEEIAAIKKAAEMCFIFNRLSTNLDN